VLSLECEGYLAEIFDILDTSAEVVNSTCISLNQKLAYNSGKKASVLF
jgi:hypothetical protein